MTENELIKLITDWLAINKVFHFRQNTGAFKTKTGGFYRFGHKGAGDIVVIIHGRHIEIECKVGRNKLSEHQIAFKEALESAGGIYIEARDLETVVEAVQLYRQMLK
jgi:hypothetical protein